MAMVSCRECRKDVSTQATVCPHCGCPNPVPSITERENTKTGALILTGIISIIVVATTCNRSTSPPPPLPVSVTPPAPKPPPPPLHPDVIKARAAVDKIKDEVFCATLGKAMRNPKGNSLDYQAALINRAEEREGMTTDMLAGIMGRRPVLGMNCVPSLPPWANLSAPIARCGAVLSTINWFIQTVGYTSISITTSSPAFRIEADRNRWFTE